MGVCVCLQAAEAAAEAARSEVALSKLASDARQQAVWALSQQVQELELELTAATQAASSLRRNASSDSASLYAATAPLREAQVPSLALVHSLGQGVPLLSLSLSLCVCTLCPSL
jgi:CBS domain containing-hemolysin-like protein